jgi:hypothetical protein
MDLFSGSLAERRALYRDFRAFCNQARTYWEAGAKTNGSAAALPYYYATLQLAKAELLKTNPAAIRAQAIMHGLKRIPSATTSIRSDVVQVTRGVFPLLYRKRTGSDIPVGTRIRALDLLSLIPEIGLEMSKMAPSRPSSFPGNYSLAMDDSRAWSVVMLRRSVESADREPLSKRFLAAYEEVSMDQFPNWREVFSMSSRAWGRPVHLFQAKQTVSMPGPNGQEVPDTNTAIEQLIAAVGFQVRPPVREREDFYVTPTLQKSKPLAMPLDLIRYASMFYLSSLVRYQPAALDPVGEGAQAYLMDSFAHEVPMGLLVGALDGITGAFSYFDPTNKRL